MSLVDAAEGKEGEVFESGPPTPQQSPGPKMSLLRKRLLVVVFSLAQFIDVSMFSCVVIALADVTVALDLPYEQSSWIVSSCALSFSAFLLFAGRLSDVYSARWTFLGGFAALGALNLGLSWVRNKYAFLLIRGLTGVAGSMTIPSAINLIVHLADDPAERSQMLALFILSGAVANSLGLVLGGVLMLASPWWIFRTMAILVFVGVVSAFLLLPATTKAPVSEKAAALDGIERHKWKRLDLVGVTIVTVALILFILGLTQGSIKGWRDPTFIAPLVLSLVLFPAFFYWESRLPDTHAMLPSSTWSIPGFTTLALMGLLPYIWWSVNQVQIATYDQEVSGYSPILTAARLLPLGLAGLAFGVTSNALPVLLARPKWTIMAGIALGIIAEVLIILSNGGRGKDYWRFLFPAYLLGSFGALGIFQAANVGIVLAVDEARAGVAGAAFNVIAQIGTVLGLSIQAGLTASIGEGITDWKSSQAGFYMCIAFLVLLGAQFLVFYKPKQHDTRAKQQEAESVEAEKKV